MITIDKINHLIQQSGKSKAEFLLKCNFNHSMYDDWTKKKMNPTSEKLIKIADYFNVSVDYLLGRDENTVPSISALSLLQERCGLLTESEQEYVLRLVDTMLKARENQKIKEI